MFFKAAFILFVTGPISPVFESTISISLNLNLRIGLIVTAVPAPKLSSNCDLVKLIHYSSFFVSLE